MAFTFNTRYKPKTEREYTKTDLTVYDSTAGHPQEITIYGKSEVVNNDIHSVGEGWATVDMGTLTWSGTIVPNLFQAAINGMYRVTNREDRNKHFFCSAYPPSTTLSASTEMDDPSMLTDSAIIFVYDTRYTQLSDFVASLGDAIVCYELADPTQGNALSVKTDDGTGIDGTMATFTTGLPLYGIEGGARDSMWCDGVTGNVAKNCGVTYPAQGNIIYWSANDVFILTSLNFKLNTPLMCSKFQYKKVTSSWNELSDGEFGNTSTTQIGFKYSQAQGDIDVFKAYINNMQLIYELATPTTTPLTAAEIAQFNALDTYAGTTHYSANDNPEIKIKYTIKTPTI